MEASAPENERETMSENERETIDAEAIVDRFRDLLNCETDTALGEKLGLTQSTISNWRRRNSVPLDYIVDISRRTGRTIDYLIFGDSGSIERSMITSFDKDILGVAIPFACEASGIDRGAANTLTRQILLFYNIVRASVERDMTISDQTFERAISNQYEWLKVFLNSDNAHQFGLRVEPKVDKE